VWVSFAPACRLWLAASGGPRTFQSALVLIPMTAAVVRGGPCCCSDGFRSSLPAWGAVEPQLKAFARTGKRGPPRHAGPEPHPDLVEAPLIQEKQPGRLQALTEREPVSSILTGVPEIVRRGVKIDAWTDAELDRVLADKPAR